jgi:hypothetical protein
MRVGVKWVQSINSFPASLRASPRMGEAVSCTTSTSTTRRLPIFGGMADINVTPPHRRPAAVGIICSVCAELDMLMPAISNISTHLCHFFGVCMVFQPSLPVHAGYIGISLPGDQATRLLHSAGRNIRLLGRRGSLARCHLYGSYASQIHLLVSECVYYCAVLLLKNPSVPFLPIHPGVILLYH